MKEYQVGETFFYEGQWYITVQGHFCGECCFTGKTKCGRLRCTPVSRSDQNDVIYKHTLPFKFGR